MHCKLGFFVKNSNEHYTSQKISVKSFSLVHLVMLEIQLTLQTLKRVLNQFFTNSLHLPGLPEKTIHDPVFNNCHQA